MKRNAICFKPTYLKSELNWHVIAYTCIEFSSFFQSSAESNDAPTGGIIIEPEEPKAQVKVIRKRKPSLSSNISRPHNKKIEPVVTKLSVFMRNKIKIYMY